MAKLTGGDKSGIRWLVNRMHVCTRDVDVVRDLCRRFRKNTKVNVKALRKLAYRYALKVHAENRKLYLDVIG